MKIQILNQQLEKDNEQVLDKEGLAIVPKTKNLAFLQKHVQVNKDGRQGSKITSTSRLQEDELRIDMELANQVRQSIAAAAAIYEQKFKSQVLSSRAFLQNLIQQKIEQVGEAQSVSGLVQTESVVSGTPVTPNWQAIHKKA